MERSVPLIASDIELQQPTGFNKLCPIRYGDFLPTSSMDTCVFFKSNESASNFWEKTGDMDSSEAGPHELSLMRDEEFDRPRSCRVLIDAPEQEQPPDHCSYQDSELSTVSEFLIFVSRTVMDAKQQITSPSTGRSETPTSVDTIESSSDSETEILENQLIKVLEDNVSLRKTEMEKMNTFLSPDQE